MGLKDVLKRLGSVVKTFSDAARQAALEARRAKAKGKGAAVGYYNPSSQGGKSDAESKPVEVKGKQKDNFKEDDFGPAFLDRHGMGISDYTEGKHDVSAAALAIMDSQYQDAMSAPSDFPKEVDPAAQSRVDSMISEAISAAAPDMADYGYSSNNLHLVAQWKDGSGFGVNSKTGVIYELKDLGRIGQLTGDDAKDKQTIKDIVGNKKYFDPTMD